MKKKNIYLTGLLAAVLLLAGCQKAGAEELDANADLASGSQEISILESDTEERSVEETTSANGAEKEAKEEIIVEGNNGTIRIGTTGTPYLELLTQAKIQLAKNGWDVQVETYSDYEKINQDVLNGTLDAHLFAHQTYIDSYNDVNGTELTAAAVISFEKYGMYSKSNEDLSGEADGMTVGIPEDSTRQAKALLFLQDAGYISLAENVGLTAVLEDVVENSKNIQFVTYNMDTVQTVLAEADYCVMGADQAILAGLEPHKEVLKEETASFSSARSMASLLVTMPDKVESEGLRVLEDALKSAETREFVEDTYKGALGLFP